MGIPCSRILCACFATLASVRVTHFETTLTASFTAMFNTRIYITPSLELCKNRNKGLVKIYLGRHEVVFYPVIVCLS